MVPKPIPPKKLQELFGIKVLELDTYYPDEHNSINYNNSLFQTKDYNAIIEPSSAISLAEYQQDFYQNTPAITMNHFGRGTAYFIAPRTNIDFLEVFYAPIIENNCLKDEMIIKSDNEVSIQKRSNNNYSYYFIMNFSEKEKNVELKSELFDMLINTHISSIIKLKPYEVKVLKASKI